MGKHFILKFKVSKLISSFKSCRSKHPSSLPSNPIPSSFLRLKIANNNNNDRTLSGDNTKIHFLNNNKPHRFSLKRHVSSALLSARRSFSNPRHSHDSSSSSRFRWEKQSKWHVMAKIPDQLNYDSTPPRQKIYTSAASDYDSNPPPPLNHSKRRRIPRRKIRISTSSDSGVFSDASEETDTSSPRRRHIRHHFGRKSSGSPARLSEFMRKMLRCKAEEEVVEGKVRESFAVVKRSEDPFEDFRRSMAEMVVEKEIFERKDLEELLRCFLSLNSEHLHPVIVRAFVDIWDSLFSPSSSSTTN